MFGSIKRIVQTDFAASCYFRSSVEPPYRKALLKITEWCNLRCAHCFVDAGDYGITMPFDVIRDTVIPRLKQCRVANVTLTGGEPFAHPHFLDIVRVLKNEGIRTGICTNATLINEEQIKLLRDIGNVHVNVSLDGFSPESHGKFRGNRDSFFTTVDTIRLLRNHGLLQGILVTPNALGKVEEYVNLCKFAIEVNAQYVLMNPLSNMGRGFYSIRSLRASDKMMEEIKTATAHLTKHIEIVDIRFPNDKFPLASCEAGNIIYVFTNGDTTVCPYLVFAAETPGSKHNRAEFIVGNIISDPDIARRLDEYKFHERYSMGNNSTCKSCHMASKCGKGCPAAVIASGGKIGDLDEEVCPVAEVQ